ncbi:MAG: S1C family serine protease, partial [Thermoguttaceae bacterium]
MPFHSINTGFQLYFSLICGIFIFTLSENDGIADESASMRRPSELSEAFRNASDSVLPSVVKMIASPLSAAERKEKQSAFVSASSFPSNRMRRLPGDRTGTGVLIDPSGIILTCNHVVMKAKEIEVELPDGRIFYAKKYRHDPETDLAIVWLDVDPDDELPFTPFGDSDNMEIGDWVLAIGNPFELDSTVSAGIISAKGRSLRQIQRTEFLQTDAA